MANFAHKLIFEMPSTLLGIDSTMQLVISYGEEIFTREISAENIPKTFNFDQKFPSMMRKRTFE